MNPEFVSASKRLRLCALLIIIAHQQTRIEATESAAVLRVDQLQRLKPEWRDRLGRCLSRENLLI